VVPEIALSPVTPNFQRPLVAKLYVVFKRCKNVFEVRHYHAKFGGGWILHTARDPELSNLCVCVCASVL